MMKQYEQPVEGHPILSSLTESEFIQYTISQPPSWMLIYIAVFTIYFYMSEWNSGFSKNYISMRQARSHSVFSKMTILALFRGDDVPDSAGCRRNREKTVMGPDRYGRPGDVHYIAGGPIPAALGVLAADSLYSYGYPEPVS
ncbi:hypothetical protein ACFSQ7_12740 [Paenibacillus rhizoplanae]